MRRSAVRLASSSAAGYDTFEQKKVTRGVNLTPNKEAEKFTQLQREVRKAGITKINDIVKDHNPLPEAMTAATLNMPTKYVCFLSPFFFLLLVKPFFYHPDGWHRTVGQLEVPASTTTVFFLL